LEAAAHAHERVYNLGPSFRNESRTNCHLREYWHIKAEVCSGQISDIIDLVEIFLRDISATLSPFTLELTKIMGTKSPKIQIPFKRLTYVQALTLFGQNVFKRAEDLLTTHFAGPVCSLSTKF
jgi:aspartyl/asparaginyl-tRNA synthetase